MASDYREKLRILELQEELERYQRDLAKTTDAIDLQNTIIVALSVAAVLLGMGIFYLIRQQARRKREMDNLRTKAEEARKSLESREKFVAFVNHEIRTPLNAVSGSAQLLQKTTLNEKQARYVQTIKASVENVLVLVNDVLDLSRVESGKIEFRLVDFILSELLNGIRYILQEKVESKGIEFDVEVADDVPEVLIGDSAHLNQILLNLANNAVKFTDLGKVTLFVEEVRRSGDTVRLRFNVADTGKGIRKSKLQSIFNQFEQETRHTIKHSGGSGLGLAITKQLVEKQGGCITVHSKYMEGSTFSVELDFRHGSMEKAMKGRRRTKVDPSVLEGLELLVVDDNQMNREIISDLLTDLNDNVTVHQAEAADKAFEKLSNLRIDVVMMDIQMPQMDGFAATRYIREKLPEGINHVPVIAMTAHALEDVSTKCFEAGMNDYISKPVDISFLVSKIDRLMQRKLSALQPMWEHTDLLHLSKLAGGDQQKILRYIDIFMKEAPQDVESLKLALEQKNWEQCESLMHKLKGSAGYMGDKIVASAYSRFASMNMSDAAKQECVTLVLDTCTAIIGELKAVQRDHKLLFLDIQSKK